MLRFMGVAIALLLSLSAIDANATKLSGKIVITAKFRDALAALEKQSDEGKMRGYWNDPNGMKQVLPPLVDPSSDFAVVVYKKDAPAPKPDKIQTVNVLAGAMERNVVALRPGSRLKFVMMDPFDHELYSPGMDEFAPQKQAQRSFRPVDFKSEGIFEVRCKLMPHFKGWVVIAAATQIPTMKKDGTFALDDLEEGSYTIKVFFGGKWIKEKKFKVEKRQREVEVEIKLEDPAASSPAQSKKKEKKKEKASEKASETKEAEKGDAKAEKKAEGKKDKTE